MKLKRENQKVCRKSLVPDAPEWLADLDRTVGQVSAAGMLRGQHERPLDELSAHLMELRERGLSLTDIPAETSAALASLLPGVEQTLPPATFETTPSDISTSVVLTDEQRQHIELLESLVGRASEDSRKKKRPKTARRRLRIPGRADRFIISLLLALVMILPFFIDGLNIGDLPPVRFASHNSPAGFLRSS